MEWTIDEQLLFLLQSFILGAGMAILYETVSRLVLRITHKHSMIADIIWGPILALFTMFGALVIMDGHLHPILFLGIIIGAFGIRLLIVWYIRFFNSKQNSNTINTNL